jgi:hypothetical protein
MPTEEPEEDVSWRELRSVLDEELDRLPEKYRAPLVLCFLEGKTQDEAARELDWTAGAVKGRLERGRHALRSRLSRRGVTLSTAFLTTVLTRKATVEAALLDTTVRTATLMVAGQVDSAMISIQVARLAAGAARAMLMTKIKVGAAILLVASTAAAGMGMLAHGLVAEKLPDARQEEPFKGFAKAVDRPGTAKYYEGRPARSWLLQLEDGDAMYRQEAVQALENIGRHDPSVIPPLGEMLKDSNKLVRLGTALALRRLGADARPALPALLGALDDDDQFVRSNAIAALGCIDPQDQAILAVLAKSLKDPSPTVRRMALGALGEIGPTAKESLAAVRAALTDDDTDVRKAAAEALHKIERHKE